MTMTMTEVMASFAKAAEGVSKIQITAPKFDSVTWDSLKWTAVSFTEPECPKPTIDYKDLPPLETEKVVDRFRREVHAVVREAGTEHICLPRYSTATGGLSFWYVHGGQPDCLVGRVLVRMGVPVEELAGMEHMNASHVVPAVWGHIGSGTYEDMTPTVELALRVQRVNDGGLSWGNALMC